MNRLTMPLLASAALCLALVACNRQTPTEPAAGAPASAPAAAGEPTADEARAIAKDAYIWGYPLVENYKTLYQQALDQGGPNFHAPLNQIGHSANVATPKDTAIITPNSDTPYSFLWMDLRAEPLVLSIPAMGDKRYFSVQLIDLYTFNFDYINQALTKGKAGNFLIAGPDWKGETPKGVDKVIRSETPFAYALFRTQLFDPKDLDNVKRLQSQYKVQPLSAFAGTPAPAAPPAVQFPPYDARKANDVGFFSYLSFLLPYAPLDDSEAALRDRLAKIGVVPGKPFDENALSPAMRQALLDGIGDANKEFENFAATQMSTDKVRSADMFGTRAHLKGNALYRFAGAKQGIYGNSASEADYQGYLVDAKGQPLDASRHDYALRFPKDGLPPTNAFWSITMYDGPTKLLVDNPLNRYLINSPMLGSLKRDADGGITLYLQHASPGKDKEANWLPAPDGPFYAILRNYSPKPEVIDRTWTRPPLETTR
ncbi:DUF1254 domain-containing protein [Lysobacter sp. MMG2]|uniref:DUF1254 domain-containing protein n=1 Tax=Lysobacter sp. MMG2 TaxID=2801338 RepID=UPI001C24D494|nr:DUF1254 domain-containing protein [Lysobacter sp. MMG2]MBU8976596.1 DUF1254 domain-containing protein [Lysobacter sp. MMG2]